jgi:SAM-dependent methyltransferase
MTDPTHRFTGLAADYAKARPSYPQEALDFIVEHCGLRKGDLIVDVGCGTGISSRLFIEMGFSVIGIEPNADMRQQAEEEPRPRLMYNDGTAEATGIDSDWADAVVSAQAFHWFKAEPALAEFKRILRPGGWVILIWNERDERNAVTAGYGAALRETPETHKVETERFVAGEPLLQSPLFESREKRSFPNSQLLDKAGFVKRAFSASYAPKEGPPAAKLKAILEQLFDDHNQNGVVEMLYSTNVYVGRKQV